MRHLLDFSQLTALQVEPVAAGVAAYFDDGNADLAVPVWAAGKHLPVGERHSHLRKYGQYPRNPTRLGQHLVPHRTTSVLVIQDFATLSKIYSCCPFLLSPSFQTLFFRYFIPFFTYDFEELITATTYDFEEFPLAIDENFDIIRDKTKDFKTLCT